MVPRNHLRETLGLSWVGLMTPDTQDDWIGLHGLVASRVLGMRGSRAVTCFATDFGVRAFALGLGDVRMARFADLPPGESNRAGSNFVERRSAIMLVLTEAFRDNGLPDKEENNHSGSQKERHSQ